MVAPRPSKAPLCAEVARNRLIGRLAEKGDGKRHPPPFFLRRFSMTFWTNTPFVWGPPQKHRCVADCYALPMFSVTFIRHVLVAQWCFRCGIAVNRSSQQWGTQVAVIPLTYSFFRSTHILPNDAIGGEGGYSCFHGFLTGHFVLLFSARVCGRACMRVCLCLYVYACTCVYVTVRTFVCLKAIGYFQ